MDAPSNCRSGYDCKRFVDDIGVNVKIHLLALPGAPAHHKRLACVRESAPHLHSVRCRARKMNLRPTSRLASPAPKRVLCISICNTFYRIFIWIARIRPFRLNDCLGAGPTQPFPPTHRIRHFLHVLCRFPARSLAEHALGKYRRPHTLARGRLFASGAFVCNV